MYHARLNVLHRSLSLWLQGDRTGWKMSNVGQSRQHLHSIFQREDAIADESRREPVAWDHCPERTANSL